MNNKYAYLRWWLLLAVFVTSLTVADDSEIYYSQADSANPNILFLLDNSGSMSAIVPDSGGKTRMKVMQEAFSAMLTSAPSNLNIGLMRYGGHTDDQANGVSFPVKPIDLDKKGSGDAKSIITDRIALSQDNLPDPANQQPVREFLKDVANGWSAQGVTPIVDALYEASRYYRGENVQQGAFLPNTVKAAHPSAYQGTLLWDAKGGKCDAPFSCLKELCWAGYIVPGSCETKPISSCVWGKTSETGSCCGGLTPTLNEAGQALSWSCTNGDYSCPTFGCTHYEDQNREVCTTKYCAGTATNEVAYVSPMQQACQANYIVLMSDGKPEYSSGTTTLPPSASKVETLVGSTCVDSPSGYKSGTCGPELTKFMAENDQSTTLSGKQTVSTFTVAFGLDDPNGTAYLSSLANISGGALAANDGKDLQVAFDKVIQQVNQIDGNTVASADVTYRHPSAHVVQQPVLARYDLFQQAFAWLGEGMALINPLNGLHRLAAANNGAFNANDFNSLSDAFKNILDKIDASASSFSSPTYTVDKNNLLAHNNEVYIPVFERSMLPLWSGNLKKFKLKNGKIVGHDNKSAVDDKGIFTVTAWDEWSTTASGKEVKEGGVASQLPAPTERKLYTDSVNGTMDNLDVNNTTLTIDKLYKDGDGDNGHGNNLTGCDPDNPNAAKHQSCQDYRATLINFARGVGKNGQPRKHIGDIMNSKPLVMDYTDGGYVLVGTNEGFLHAFNTNTGVEEWAFMPQSLLRNIPLFYENNQVQQHVYGIDGQFTPWIKDKNGNGKVDSADGDKAYLFFGMRRGGREYYALDISDINAPKIAWKISNNTFGFSELGESWSKPALVKLRVANKKSSELKDVLVFGAGFDPALEDANPSTRQADSMGRDVFIVDAADGSLLWSLRQDVSGAASALGHSIPADIRVLDMDRNGALDRLYFADTGGNVWRVDMDMDLQDADSDLFDYKDAKLTHFAALGGNDADQRKFYYEPDIALMNHNGNVVMTLAIGSGYRSHPQYIGIQDRFYVLMEENVYTHPPATFITIEDTDSNLIEADALAATGKSLLDGGKKGWYYALPNKGEKVLAPAITALNKVIFTTFANDSDLSTDPCNKPSNTARAYVLDLYNGQAVANLDRSTDSSNDKSVVAGVNEILSGGQVVFLDPTAKDGSACKQGDCLQSVEIRVGKMSLPVIDRVNAPDEVKIGDILPRIFWRDDDVDH